MRKLLFILALGILPALTFAQGAGGQIKRPVKKQQSSSQRTQTKKTAQPAKKSPANMQTSSQAVNNSQGIKQFFPVWGITLNETTMSQAKAMGHNLVVDVFSSNSNKIRTHGFSFYDWDKNGYINGMSNELGEDYDFPDEWKSKGFSLDNSYDRWIQVFKELGFSVSVNKLPLEEINLQIEATSLDKTLSFVLSFSLGDNGDIVLFTFSARALTSKN